MLVYFGLIEVFGDEVVQVVMLIECFGVENVVVVFICLWCEGCLMFEELIIVCECFEFSVLCELCEFGDLVWFLLLVGYLG